MTTVSVENLPPLWLDVCRFVCFFAFLWTETKSRSIKRPKRTRLIPSLLDRTRLVNKSQQDWHNKPTRVIYVFFVLTFLATFYDSIGKIYQKLGSLLFAPPISLFLSRGHSRQSWKGKMSRSLPALEAYQNIGFAEKKQVASSLTAKWWPEIKIRNLVQICSSRYS